MTESWPSWRALTSNLREMLQEIEIELNTVTTKNDTYQAAWEWLRLFQAVMTESMRTRDWMIDVHPIGNTMLCQIRGLNRPRLNNIAMRFQETLKVIDEFITESS
jgi:hypothetical protein